MWELKVAFFPGFLLDGYVLSKISTLNYNKKCSQVIIKDQGEEFKNFRSETVLCNMLYLYVYILYVPTENTDS